MRGADVPALVAVPTYLLYRIRLMFDAKRFPISLVCSILDSERSSVSHTAELVPRLLQRCFESKIFAFRIGYEAWVKI